MTDQVVEYPSPIPGPPGYSAYQIAVQNGFVGSQSAWLASLQGTDGTNGNNGAAWYSGAGAPSGLGVPGDWYINDTNGDIYNNVAGTWVLKLNVTAAEGVVSFATSQSLSSAQEIQAQANIGLALTGLLKGASSDGIVVATAGTDYLAPNGSGAALTGLTAGQIGGLGNVAPLSVGTGLSGIGGVLAVVYGTGTGQAAAGNDSRLVNALQASGTALPASYVSAPGLSLPVGQITGLGALAVLAAGTGLTVSGSSLAIANVVSPGTVGGAAAIPVLTYNAQGQVTGVTTAAVAAPAGTLTGTALPSTVTGSSLTSVGTLTAGVVPTGLLSGTLQAGQFPALTGDLTTVAGALATTLATVNSTVGSFGGASSIPIFTVNGKGLVTAAGATAVVAPAGALSGSTLASGVVNSSLTSIGTLVSGAVGASLVTPGTFAGSAGYTFAHGLTVNGGLTTDSTATNFGGQVNTSGGSFVSTGSSAGMFVYDRTTSGQAGLYRTGGLNRLYDATFGDVVQYDTSGNVTALGPALTLSNSQNNVTNLISYNANSGSGAFGQLQAQSNAGRVLIARASTAAGNYSQIESDAASLYVDSLSGVTYFRTGSGPTTALTLDASQTATFAQGIYGRFVNVYGATSYIQSGLAVSGSGGLQVTGTIAVNGSTCQLYVADQTASGAFGAYRSGGVTYWFDSAGGTVFYFTGSTMTTAKPLVASAGLQIGSGNVPIANANYAASATDNWVSLTGLTAPRTVTLPAANALAKGQPFAVDDGDGSCSATNTITLAAAGSDTIMGQASIVIAVPYGGVKLHSNGSNRWSLPN